MDGRCFFFAADRADCGTSFTLQALLRQLSKLPNLPSQRHFNLLLLQPLHRVLCNLLFNSQLSPSLTFCLPRVTQSTFRDLFTRRNRAFFNPPGLFWPREQRFSLLQLRLKWSLLQRLQPPPFAHLTPHNSPISHHPTSLAHNGATTTRPFALLLTKKRSLEPLRVGRPGVSTAPLRV